MTWVEHVECIGQMRNVYKILIGKPEGIRRFGGTRHRWEDNITTHTLPALDQLGIVHTKKHNTQMHKTRIIMTQNFMEFY
jgi:hypothetical protein